MGHVTCGEALSGIVYHYVGLRTGCGRCVRCERCLLGQRCLHVSSHRTAMSARFVTQDSNACTFRHTGQQCLHVSSQRTAMSARFVTQDSDVCTFHHTGQGVKHKPRRKIVLPLYLSFSFFLCFYLSCSCCLYGPLISAQCN